MLTCHECHLTRLRFETVDGSQLFFALLASSLEKKEQAEEEDREGLGGEKGEWSRSGGKQARQKTSVTLLV